MKKIQAMKFLFFILVLVTLYSSLITVASAADIESILKDHIKQNYPWAEVEISDLMLSAEPPEAMPQRILVSRGLPGKTIFNLEYKNGLKIAVTANVKAFDWVVMTRRAFRKGYVLQKEDVYTTVMDITRIPKDTVKTSDRLIGTSLTRSVLANMPVVSGMTGESALVKRGTRVTIIAEAEGFSISARGELKENGYVGNDVKVLNTDSKRIITGILSSENTVKVVF